MREDVAIVLNEREPLKEQMALELQAQLELRNICNERIKPTPNLANIIIERNPKILVIDYLLEDIGTALDILSDISAPDVAKATIPIVWTDEPSVSVAVTAMKLGAFDYIEFGSSNSLEKVVAAIEDGLRQHKAPQGISAKTDQPSASERPIGNSIAFQKCIALAEAAAENDEPIVVLLGAPGCGRNTIAQFIHNSRPQPGALIEIDFDTWPHSVDIICGNQDDHRLVPYLSNAATVVIDHADSDTGYLVDAVVKEQQQIWERCPVSQIPMLVIGTSNAETARCWTRLTDAQVIEIPGLDERPDDLYPLMQHFIAAIQSGVKLNKLKFSTSLLTELTSIQWPGNVRQFRAAIVEAAVIPTTLLSKEFKANDDSEDESENKAEKSDHTKNDRMIFSAIINAKDRWEHYWTRDFFVPQPLEARNAIDQALGDLRVAAARLGTGIPQLRQALNGEVNDTTTSKKEEIRA